MSITVYTVYLCSVLQCTKWPSGPFAFIKIYVSETTAGIAPYVNMICNMIQNV